MDCNNNDGTNYLYQMQQTMNSAMNGMTNNSLGSNMQSAHQSPMNYDKKSFDLASSNNSIYLNGHPAVTPPLNNNGNIVSNHNNLPNNLPPQQTNGQFNNLPNGVSNNMPNAISPPSANRINQYSDYNAYNGSANYYNNYNRSLHYNQPPPSQLPNHLNHPINNLNHPVNHHPANQPINANQSNNNQISSKERHQINYLPNNEEHNNQSTNHHMYNHHINQSNHLPNLHHSSSQAPLPNLIPVQHSQSNHHNSIVQQQHHSTTSNQPASLPTSATTNPPSNLNPNLRPLSNLNQNNYSQPPLNYQQQPHSYNSNNNSLVPVNSNAGYNQAYDQNYYNYNEQWRYQNHHPHLPATTNSPNQVQINNNNNTSNNNLNQANQSSKSSNLTNLNNSANLSQPYSNMHISSPINNQLNTIDPVNNHLNQQQQFHANQNNFIPINNGYTNNNYTPNQQQPNYLPPPSQTNPQLQQAPNQYHQLQPPVSSPHPNNNTDHQQNQQPPPPTQHHNVAFHNKKLNTSSQSALEALDQTLDSVVNGAIKPKRKRGKGKATKEKAKRETKSTSAYALFFKQVQHEIKKTSPKISFGEISKTVAQQWGSLPEEHKQGYKSITDKERKFKLEELAKEKAMQVSGHKIDIKNESND